MSEKDEVRKNVSIAYARAVQGPGGCCEGSQKGVLAPISGYNPSELSDLPQNAVANAFGCGDPVALSGIEPGDTVLDLGSGAGIDLLLAAKKAGPGGKVIGVDMTDEMIERARENVREAGLDNVEVRKGIIEELPVEDASVDWVISNCVINLSPDKPRVFAEIARVLKPGGRMLVSDIVARDLPAWARLSQDLYCSCVGGAISEEEYIEGLEKAGLVDVEVKSRLIYDTALAAGLLESEINQGDSCGCGCGASISKEDLQKMAGEITGKVWSARFQARKPG